MCKIKMNINIYESVEYFLKAKAIVVNFDNCKCDLGGAIS